MLWSFRTHPERFPNGLKPLIDQGRRDYGVKVFGVGIRSKATGTVSIPPANWGKSMRSWRAKNAPGKTNGSVPEKRSMVHPEAAGRFLDDYHRALREQGVDMVKVDNQGSMDRFATAEVPPTSTVRAYQYALQDASRPTSMVRACTA